MDSRRLVDYTNDGTLASGRLAGGDVGVERGGQVELEALGDLVVELDGVSKDVGRVPDLTDANRQGKIRQFNSKSCLE